METVREGSAQQRQLKEGEQEGERGTREFGWRGRRGIA